MESGVQLRHTIGQAGNPFQQTGVFKRLVFGHWDAIFLWRKRFADRPQPLFEFDYCLGHFMEAVAKVHDGGFDWGRRWWRFRHG